MKHSSSQSLYAYWNELRGSRAAPERADIEPAAIHRVLGNSFILAFDHIGGHPFRLAGTQICGLFGRELRGEAFADLWQPDDRAALIDIVTIVADDAAAVVAGATGWTPADDPVDLELLLLPLRHHGHTHARQIGVLAPLSLPYWLGSTPVTVLELGAHRHISMLETVLAARGASSRGRRLPNGLTVYDGGRG